MRKYKETKERSLSVVVCPAGNKPSLWATQVTHGITDIMALYFFILFLNKTKLFLNIYRYINFILISDTVQLRNIFYNQEIDTICINKQKVVSGHLMCGCLLLNCL